MLQVIMFIIITIIIIFIRVLISSETSFLHFLLFLFIHPLQKNDRFIQFLLPFLLLFPIFVDLQLRRFLWRCNSIWGVLFENLGCRRIRWLRSGLLNVLCWRCGFGSFIWSLRNGKNLDIGIFVFVLICWIVDLRLLIYLRCIKEVRRMYWWTRISYFNVTIFWILRFVIQRYPKIKCLWRGRGRLQILYINTLRSR